MSGLGQRFAFPPLIQGYAGLFGSIPSGASDPSQGVGDKLGQIALNVKDFGAKGDGSHDDTSSIQACLNAAFGTPASPHGTSYELNSRVYFPPGHYIVTSPASTKTVSNAQDDGATFIKLTLNDVTGLVVGAYVNVENVGGTTEANGCWPIKAISGSTITLDHTLFTHAWTSGGTVSSTALTICNVRGAHIFGAGRNTTKITNSTSGGTILTTDGFQYSRIELIDFRGSGTGSTGLLLNHNTSAFASVQSNTLADCFFNGMDRGVTLASGNDGSSWGQGSEILFLNCWFASCGVYGLASRNANALQVTVLGGNFQSNAIGIDCVSGSINIIIGVGFQLQSDYDIKIEGSASNTMFVAGCRSESPNFINNAGTQDMHIAGNQQYRGSGSRGFFYNGAGGMVHMSGCQVIDGKVKVSDSTRICIQACQFGGESVVGDWLDTSNVASWRKGVANGGSDPQLFIEIENVISSGSGTIGSINKRRIYTDDQIAVTTKNYTVGP